MHFIVSSSALLKQLQLVSGVVGSSVVMSILEDFLFEIKDGILTISATDLETSMVTSLPVESQDKGSVAIPAKTLLDTLKILPEQPINFKIDTKTHLIEITSSNGKYKLNGENGMEFPKIPQAEDVQEIAFASHILNRGISKCLFALSNDQMRPAMTGMLLQVDNTGVNMVSTDAHKLVKYHNDEVKMDDSAQVIIPKKALNILKNTLNAASDIQLAINKNNAFVTIGDVYLVCRLIDATFPNFNAVIPTGNTNFLSVNRLDIVNAIRRITIYSNKSSNQVVMKITGSELHLNGQDVDFSQEANETMNCDYKGEDMSIAFNGKFLVEILTQLDTENVRFEMSLPSRAVLILPEENEADEDLTMLIMPIMVNS